METQTNFELYFKLITKEIIFIIKILSLEAFKNEIGKNNNLNLEYYIIKKKQIKLTERFEKMQIY